MIQSMFRLIYVACCGVARSDSKYYHRQGQRQGERRTVLSYCGKDVRAFADWHTMAVALNCVRRYLSVSKKPVTPGKLLSLEQHVYTDASISKKLTGLGVVWQSPKEVKTLHAQIAEKDINKAELAAIFIGLLFSDPQRDVTVFTDSGASLDHLICPGRRYATLVLCIRTLVSARQNITQFVKVKAHVGVDGNDHADTLARIGRESGFKLMCPDDISIFHRTTSHVPTYMLLAYLDIVGIDRNCTVLRRV